VLLAGSFDDSLEELISPTNSLTGRNWNNPNLNIAGVWFSDTKKNDFQIRNLESVSGTTSWCDCLFYFRIW